MAEAIGHIILVSAYLITAGAFLDLSQEAARRRRKEEAAPGGLCRKPNEGVKSFLEVARTGMSSLMAGFLEYSRRRGLDRRSFLVGGGVRDLLLGSPLKDVDIALGEDPRAVAADFATAVCASCVALDEDYKIYRVVQGDEYIDLSPLRGGSIESDLAQRDLTINAMALPLVVGAGTGTSARLCRAGAEESGPPSIPGPICQRSALAVIDPHGGREDIARRVIRMVSEENFVKDPLRLLRVYRFAATLGFTVDVRTASAVRRHGARISQVAVERIMEEMRRIFAVRWSSGVIEKMEADGLLFSAIPELAALSGEERLHNRQSYRYLEHILHNLSLYFPAHADRISPILGNASRTVALKMACLLGHESAVRAAAERLRMSGRERALLAVIVREADFLQRDFTTGEIARLLRGMGDEIHAAVVYGIARRLVCQAGEDPLLARARRIVSFYHDEFAPRLARLPLLTGNDLMREFGLSPSPLIGEVLDRVGMGVLDGSIADRDQALSAAGRMIAGKD